MGKIDDEIQVIAGDIAEKKSAVVMNNFATLMKTIQNGIDDFLDSDEKREYYDKGLGGQIATAVEKAITAFTKNPQKAPIVNVSSPQVNVDLQPVADAITKQNDTIIDILNKMNSGDNSGELYRLITAMVGKQNAFIEKGFQQINYSDKLDKLIEAVGNKKEEREIEELQIKRNNFGALQSVVPIYKK